MTAVAPLVVVGADAGYDVSFGIIDRGRNVRSSAAVLSAEALPHDPSS